MRILTLRTRLRSKACCASTSPLRTRQLGFHFAKQLASLRNTEPSARIRYCPASATTRSASLYAFKLASTCSSWHPFSPTSVCGHSPLLATVPHIAVRHLSTSILTRKRKRVWAFSIACDGSTHRSMSFIDIHSHPQARVGILHCLRRFHTSRYVIYRRASSRWYRWQALQPSSSHLAVL